MDDFQYYELIFKLKASGHFSTLWGSSNPLAIELWVAKSETQVFAKNKRWHQIPKGWHWDYKFVAKNIKTKNNKNPKSRT